MKKMQIVLLMIMVPLLILGLQNYNATTAYNSHQDSALKLPGFSKPIAPISKDRSWRLSEQVYVGLDGLIYTLLDKYNYYYNSGFPARLDSIIVSYYVEDTEPFDWVANDNYRYYYDASGEYITCMDYYFLFGQTVLHRFTGEYDAQNRLTEVIEHSYYNNRTLHPIARTNVLYENGLVSSFVSYYYPSGTGSGAYYKKALTKDTQGRVVMQTEQSSADSINWTNNMRTLYTYHQDDTSTGQSYVDYISHHMVENGFDYLALISDIPGMTSFVTVQSYMDSVWVDMYRYIDNYDTSGRHSSRIYQVSIDQGPWQNEIKYEYTYNQNGNLIMKTLCSWGTTDWLFTSNLYEYTWEQFNPNEDENITTEPLNMSVYPNPFNDNVYIRFDGKDYEPVETSVYNIRGQLIKSLGNSRKTSVTWDGKDNHGKSVSNGIYFIKATQDGKSISKKVIRIK